MKSGTIRDTTIADITIIGYLHGFTDLTDNNRFSIIIDTQLGIKYSRSSQTGAPRRLSIGIFVSEFFVYRFFCLTGFLYIVFLSPSFSLIVFLSIGFCVSEFFVYRFFLVQAVKSIGQKPDFDCTVYIGYSDIIVPQYFSPPTYTPYRIYWIQ